MYKCYLPDISKQISIVNFCRREEVLSVTFNILNEEAAADSRDDVISMHRLLNEILSTFLKSDKIKLKQAVRSVVRSATICPRPCKWWLVQSPRAAWWSFDFGTGAESGGTTTFLPILVFLRLFVFELWANMHQTDDMTLLPWPLTFRPLNGDTNHPCHGFPYCHFFSFLNTPFRSRLMVRHGTDRRLMPHPMGAAAWKISFLSI